LKESHANEIDILSREIAKIHKFLDSRNEEIENISRERNQMRQAL
jgi:prefoldin subunit 5